MRVRRDVRIHPLDFGLKSYAINGAGDHGCLLLLGMNGSMHVRSDFDRQTGRAPLGESFA